MATKTKALLIATHNAHKTSEFREIFGARFEVSDLTSRPSMPTIAETGETFEANSQLKADGISRVLPEHLVLADDSGLEVDLLGGEPGVYSARYSGPEATDTSNRTLLLENLAALDKPDEERRARFRCVLTLSQNGQVLAQTSGAVEGHISLQERGEGGFGYDPIFIPEGHEETFAELSAATKNSMSHRGRAVVTMKEAMAKLGLW